MKKAEPLSDFDLGYVLACVDLDNLHDQPRTAADVIRQADISWRSVLATKLTDYDMKALRKIKSERGGKVFLP